MINLFTGRIRRERNPQNFLPSFSVFCKIHYFGVYVAHGVCCGVHTVSEVGARGGWRNRVIYSANRGQLNVANHT